ncbi:MULTISPECIES: beta-ketoacyl synthase N-terminal-like domain-containing protein [unclassified Streptomyces]|uniref:beta-ketoacyl synthase N-terminal-like domain-containing protein n=1 Tax=unclassified Streptomyces TaxID=2593676 RepID=UPI0037F42C86
MPLTPDDYLVRPPAPARGDTFRTLPDVFAEAVATRGDAYGVRGARRRWTWRQWDEESAALGAGLRRLGVGAGDVVAVQLPNSWEFLLAHVAIAAAGAVMLPLHRALGEREVRALLERAGARLLVVSADAAGALPTARPACVRHTLVTSGPPDAPAGPEGLTGPAGSADPQHPTTVSSFMDLVRAHAGARPDPVPVTPDAPFVLLPSSGTTSARPKICLHSHGGLLSNAAAVADDGRADADRTLISASPFTHLFGLLSVHLTLLTGARQALLPAWDVDALRALADPGERTALFAVPAQLRDLTRRAADPTAPEADVRLHEVRTGGAAVPGDLVTDVRRLLGAATVVQWGMSELGAGTYTRPGDPPEAAVRGIGRPVTGSAARVAAPDGTPCPDGETGELQFRGPHLFRGYLGDPVTTRAAFTGDGWLRTGDRAVRHADGSFSYRGREAELINVGGTKFSASEVEGLLAGLPFAALAVGARPDPRLGEIPCLVATPRPGADVGLDEVRAHLRAKGVAEYKWPLDLLLVDEVPMTPTGKVARAALASLLAAPAPGADPGWAAALAALGPAERLRRARDLVEEAVRETTDTAPDTGPGGQDVSPDASFRDRGIGSLAAVRLAAVLAARTGLPVSGTAVFGHPTPPSLAAHLLALAAEASGTRTGTGIVEEPEAGEAADMAEPADAVDTGRRADGRAGPASAASPAAHAGADADPVVITGIGCRFPGGVRTPDDLWRIVADGRETLGDFPADRGWDLAALRHPDPGHPGSTPARGGSFLDDVAGFDARFFGIAPREATAMDPQQRLLLETAWEALERAGTDPATLRGSRTGVFVGMMASDYAPRLHEHPEAHDGSLLTGNAASVASGRIAYTLGLTGPALTVDTACSSSLVALHLARHSLLRGECRLALAGGATVMSTPASFVDFGRQGALSTDGRCKPFAASADGAAWGEGAAVLVLERLSDAVRAGHPVLAVLAGSAVNQDGASNGLTAPSGPAQEQVIRQALADAGLSAADIDLVEAHGTGTPLGDRIEAEALLAVYGTDRPAARPLGLGSVKGNIGHTQAAAGVAGVIKTVLALRHATRPRTLHADAPHPGLDADGDGPVRLLRDALPWPPGPRPRRAAVSAFGISGTNGHLILQEPPHPDAQPHPHPQSSPHPQPPGHPHPDARPLPWVLSARTPAALRATAAALAEVPEITDPVAARQLALTRTVFDHRAVIVADGEPDELRRGLRAVAEGEWHPRGVTGRARPRTRTVFVFPGQGAQWPGMAAELLHTEGPFADSLSACDRALAAHVDWSVADVLRGAPGAPPLARDDVAQTALFAVMVALAAQWRAHGVRPDAVIGHSQGEIAAAHVAGALGLEDACAVVARRAAAVRALPPGAMATVALSRRDTTARIAASADPETASLTVAAVNAPRATVVTGPPAAVARLVAGLTAEGVRARAVPVGYASHSAAVEPLRAALLTGLADLAPRPAEVPFYSTAEGALLDTTALTAEYWYGNLRRPVEFATAVTAALADGCTAFLEMSPHPLLTHAVLETAEAADRPATAVGTLRRGEGGPERFLLSAAEAFVAGVPVRWDTAIPAPEAGVGLVDLPTYPFERARHWLTLPGRTTAPTPQPAPAPPAPDPPAPVTAPPVGPADVLDLVQALTAEILGYADGAGPAPDETFLSAGMTSLSATHLRTRLTHRLGVRLSATAVFDHPTPAALTRHLTALLAQPHRAPAPDAQLPYTEGPYGGESHGDLPDGLEALYRRALAAGRAEVALRLVGDAALLRPSFDAASHAAHLPPAVRLADGDTAPALVCLPSVVPLSGPHEYAAFARLLPGGHRVDALPHPGFAPGEALPGDAEALLAVQTAALARLGSGTSYVLCGHSSGGLVARALAARLERLGRPAAGLVLLDTFEDDGLLDAGPLSRFLAASAARHDLLGSAGTGVTRLTAAGGYLRLLGDLTGTPAATPTLLVRAARPLPGTPPDAPEPRRPAADDTATADGDHFTMMDAPHAASAAALVADWLAAR